MTLASRSWKGVTTQRRGRSSWSALTILSLAGNLILCVFWARRQPVRFHGGHPTHRIQGSCFCNAQEFCLCTPSLAVDLVILSGEDHLWLVRRRDTNQLATMGGFVQVGETAEEAVSRELQEEMGLAIRDPVLFGVYDDPRRDNRRHTASIAYAVYLDGTERPRAADDAKEVVRVSIADVDSLDFFADHRTIVSDFLRIRRGERARAAFATSKGDFADDIARSVCTPLAHENYR